MNRRLLFKSAAILCASVLVGDAQARPQKKGTPKAGQPTKPREVKVTPGVFRSTFSDLTVFVDTKAKKDTAVSDTTWEDIIVTSHCSFIVGRKALPDGFYTDADALTKLAKVRLDELANSPIMKQVVFDSITNTVYQSQKAAKAVGTFALTNSSEGRFTLYTFKKNALIYHVLGFFDSEVGRAEVLGIFSSLKWTGKMPKAAAQPATQEAKNTNPGFHWAVNRATCSGCGGRGYQTCSNCGGMGRDYHGQNCNWCYGSGRGSTCFTCNGRGYKEQWYQVPN